MGLFNKDIKVAPGRRESRPRKCKASAEDTAMNKEESLTATSGEDYQSAVARHLVENPECARSYNDGCFHVLTSGRSRWHLDLLEAGFLITQQPCLCVQKSNLNTLKLFHTITHTTEAPV